MDQYKSGSSLLMVVCFAGALSLAMLGVWRNTLYGLEASLARLGYIKSLKSTEGLLNVAVQVGIENYEKIIKDEQEIIIELPAWFSEHERKYNGTITFKPYKDALTIRASLKINDTVLRAIRCDISKETQESYRISHWFIEDII